jgi:hypothetical protein
LTPYLTYSHSHFGVIWDHSSPPVRIQNGDSESAEEGNRTLTPLRAQRPERCVSTSSTTSARCPQMVSAADRRARENAVYGSCHVVMSWYRDDSGPTEGIGATGAGALNTIDTLGV